MHIQHLCFLRSGCSQRGNINTEDVSEYSGKREERTDLCFVLIIWNFLVDTTRSLFCVEYLKVIDSYSQYSAFLWFVSHNNVFFWIRIISFCCWGKIKNFFLALYCSLLWRYLKTSLSFHLYILLFINWHSGLYSSGWYILCKVQVYCE